MLLYQKAGLGVIVTFYKGKADAIAYRKIAENALGKGETYRLTKSTFS